MKQYQIDRFWSRVNKGEPDECWDWMGGVTKTVRRTDNKGYVNHGGYGLYAYTPEKRVKQKHVYAHRLAYEILVEPIPEGMTIDHLCHNRRCCNPAHLEVVSLAENSRRGSDRMWAQIRAGERDAPQQGYAHRPPPRFITVLGKNYFWNVDDISTLVDAGFSQASLARKFGVTRQYLSWYLRNCAAKQQEAA